MFSPFFRQISRQDFTRSCQKQPIDFDFWCSEIVLLLYIFYFTNI